MKLFPTIVLLILSVSLNGVLKADSNVTTLKTEDQIQPGGLLESIITAPGGAIDNGDNALTGVAEIEDVEDFDETGESSLVENKDNVITNIMDKVASNLTANIKPDTEQISIPMDLNNLFDIVGKTLLQGNNQPDDQSKSGFVQKIPLSTNGRGYVPSSSKSKNAENTTYESCLFKSNNTPNITDWVWFQSAFYELMSNFVISDTDNVQCKQQYKTYIQNVRNLTVWAMKMRDASVLYPSGVLDTNYWHFGDFDECVGLVVPIHDIKGRYCLPKVKVAPRKEYYPGFYRKDHSKDFQQLDEFANSWDVFRENIDFAKAERQELNFGICIPHLCTVSDLQGALKKSFNALSKKYPINFDITVEDNMCYEEKTYPLGFWIFLGIFLFLITCVILSTAYDCFIVRTKYFESSDFLKTWTIPFSAIANLEKLWKNNESDEFSVIHGLKTITIVQVIMGHRQLLYFGNPSMNPQFHETRVTLPAWGYFTSGTLITDNFFVIGGFLTFYYLFQELEERKGKVNFWIIYIYRIIRITPVYLFTIAFYNYVLLYMGDGPVWDRIVGREVGRCQINWWVNLLYLNNYINEDSYCMIQSWYLACDFHFFIGGTLIVWIVWRYRKLGTPIFVFLMVFFLALPSYIIYSEKHWSIFKTTIRNNADPPADRTYREVYIKSHLRAFSYIVGLFSGYIYIKMKANETKIPWRIKWGIAFLYGIFFGHAPYIYPTLFYKADRPYDAMENAVFFSVQKIFWDSLIAFMVVGHASTGFGQASKFVGHRIFVPTSRLVFCVYLVHVIFQLLDVGSMRSPSYFSYTTLTLGTLQDVIVAFMGALLLNLMIESPLDRFQKNIMKKLLRGEKIQSSKDKREQFAASKCHKIGTTNLSLGGGAENSIVITEEEIAKA